MTTPRPAPPPITVGLVACGASKLPHPAPARELYTGNLFRAASAHAERTCDRWAILSAKHGLLMPDEEVAPYDTRITELTVDELTIWTHRVDSRVRLASCRAPSLELGVRSHAGGEVTVRLFAGEDYRRPLLTSPMWRGLSWTFEAPLAGLGIGEQLGWYRARR